MSKGSVAGNHNPVTHPEHYTWHPSGVECIEVVKHFNFCIGGAIKYLWRCEHKGRKLEDLRKAKQLIEFEIAKIGEDTQEEQE